MFSSAARVVSKFCFEEHFEGCLAGHWPDQRLKQCSGGRFRLKAFATPKIEVFHRPQICFCTMADFRIITIMVYVIAQLGVGEFIKWADVFMLGFGFATMSIVLSEMLLLFARCGHGWKRSLLALCWRLIAVSVLIVFRWVMDQTDHACCARFQARMVDCPKAVAGGLARSWSSA